MLTNRAMHKKGIDAVDRTIGKSRYALSPVAECRSTKKDCASPRAGYAHAFHYQGGHHDQSGRRCLAPGFRCGGRDGGRRGGRPERCAGADAVEPALYSHVVEVNGPHRTVYLAGQTGIDANGKIAEGFRAQAVQVMENIKTALASVGGGFEHVVKLTSYLTNLEANGAEFREVRGSYFPNKTALPASTLLQISRLANPAYLVEVEVIAILPPKA
jgi:2-iminobutanoate/2-iminopropanoate deaminase